MTERRAPCPLCGDTGRIGDDIPCWRCGESWQALQPAERATIQREARIEAIMLLLAPHIRRASSLLGRHGRG